MATETKTIAQQLLSADLGNDEAFTAIGALLESCKDENGILWLTADRITAETITVN